MAELFYKTISWNCKSTWRKSASNTLWCLLGCSIGDFGTILFFQLSGIPFPIMGVMVLAIVNGLITSVLLETFILLRQMTFPDALKTAFGMSFISMLAMELSMNTVDLVFAGGVLVWWVVPLMLIAGFLVPWPYNYYRLKKYGVSCH